MKSIRHTLWLVAECLGLVLLFCVVIPLRFLVVLIVILCRIVNLIADGIGSVADAIDIGTEGICQDLREWAGHK